MKAWLVRTSGPFAGTRYPLREPVTLIGRGPQNDVLIEDDGCVSLSHLEIRTDGKTFTLSDLSSTNGTWVNGEPTKNAILRPPCLIELGQGGPQLSFVLDEAVPADADATQRIHGAPKMPAKLEHHGLLAEALARIRLSKGKLRRAHTHHILRDVIRRAVGRTISRFRYVIAGLMSVLVCLGGLTAWKFQDLRVQKAAIEKRMADIEGQLQKTDDQQQADELLERLNQYQGEIRNVENAFLYRVGAREEANPIEAELKSLMAEFGAETYRFPPELMAQVERFVQQYQGQDRIRITNALGAARKDIELMREIFKREQLPPDLAYMAVVESAVSNVTNRTTGAAGPWQFMAPTARAFGLVVTGKVDERLDVRKSTLAASKLMRELILDFGAGGSVMLAVAAYNVGSGSVKKAVRTVKDPIKQRNFWYLYRTKALPQETRDYVPKVLAVLIIARNPSRFGFN